jgi:membrane protease YdiL (CAAX protease family)
MVASALTQSASGPYAKAAGFLHTIFVLAALAVWAFLGNILANQLSAAVHPQRVRFYAVTALFEWLLFLSVIAGVRRSGTPVLMVLGDHWHSVRQVLRDIGIAAAFWIVSTIILSILGRFLSVATLGRNMQFILPHGAVELTTWMALSFTAGICEETVFRGYLQRQFTAFTRSVPAGIFLSAVAFGAAHAYQGLRLTVLISLFGVMFGILAHWRKNVRPGMIAHAWQDSLNGVLVNIMRR